MSMFRRPGDSSSSSEASYEQREDDEHAVCQQDEAVTRVNTLESEASEIPIHAARPSLDMRGFSTQDVQALTFHAMLEQNAITTAAARLNVEASDAEAQRQGREAYAEIARRLPNELDTRYASNEFRALRMQMQERIHQTTTAHLQAIGAGAGSTRSLMMRHGKGGGVAATQPVLSDRGLPPDLAASAPWFSDLQNDRYARDFSEVEVVGKGGYGKVFKVKHKLDGHFYAVKRIVVPQAKVARVQQHGPDELNSILEEVRSLATFDHANIVRYHNAWLEFARAPEASSMPDGTFLPNSRLLEDAAPFSSSLDYVEGKLEGMQFGETLDSMQYEETSESGAGIVFEASEAEDADESQGSMQRLSVREQWGVGRRNRRSSQASQATVATLSSTKSHECEDEQVETIQRRHRPSSQEATTDVSDSVMSDSDMPERSLMRTRSTGPVLTLNVQMSLYESNLAEFLSPQRTSLSSGSQPQVQHCFHPGVSLELLSNMACGVEYLHSQGVVHRDLKPANVFLALSTGPRCPHGSVDLSTCRRCPSRSRVHVVPRIGDFGLVAALDDGVGVGVGPPRRAVGTRLYRPGGRARNSAKLDVYALGVMAVEMVYAFGTGMERGAALSRLKQGEFPDGFAEQVGRLGDKVQQLIGAMVLADEEARMGCDDARGEIGRLVAALCGE